MIADIAKILFVLALIFLFAKVLGKREAGYYKMTYNLHKAGAALATIVGFIHGLTITPLSQTYILTGWLLGFALLALFILGVVMGFKSEWIPYNDEQNQHYKSMRIAKWLLTILVIVALGAHYLVV